MILLHIKNNDTLSHLRRKLKCYKIMLLHTGNNASPFLLRKKALHVGWRNSFSAVLERFLQPTCSKGNASTSNVPYSYWYWTKVQTRGRLYGMEMDFYMSQLLDGHPDGIWYKNETL
jgi:hypothetical protein